MFLNMYLKKMLYVNKKMLNICKHDHILLVKLSIFNKFQYFFQNLKTKKIKLNIWLESDNNNNLLSPILGQYNIKPTDFINAISMQVEDPFHIKNNIIIPVIVTFIKNTFTIYFKNLYYINIINLFLTKNRYIKFNMLFFYKLYLYTKKKNFSNSLIRTILTIKNKKKYTTIYK